MIRTSSVQINVIIGRCCMRLYARRFRFIPGVSYHQKFKIYLNTGAVALTEINTQRDKYLDAASLDKIIKGRKM